MSALFEEYKASLKDTTVEATLDLYIFRPLAFIFVKLIYRFPITPNQISFMGMIIGIISGIFYAMGSATSFIFAGIFYGLTCILDCSDGMIARLKNSGTRIGRIIDGLVDYVSAIAIYTGLGIGLSRAAFDFPVSAWLLVILSAFFVGLHCILFDYYRNEFMAHALGVIKSTQEDMRSFSEELKELKRVKGKRFDKLLIRLYLFYLSVQLTRSTRKIKYNREEYYIYNKLLLHLWSWIGPTAHIFVLMIASFLYKPSIFFYFTLGAANIWMLLLWLIQVQTNKNIRNKS